MGDIADNRDIDRHILVDGGRVDVDMDLLRIGRKSIQTAGNPVIEAGADTDHDIAVMHGVIGFKCAMHAQHAEELLVGGRIGAETHQRISDGISGQTDKLGQQL